MKKTSVWVLSDGRPGHYNVSKGVLKALGLKYSVDVQWLEVRLRLGMTRTLLRMLLNSTKGSIPFWVIRLFYHLPGLPDSKPDIIVSAGGKTSFLNALLARRFDCSNIFAGSLRGLSARCFSAFITLEKIPDADNNIVVNLAPSTFDYRDIKLAGENYRKERGLEKENLWVMVIGGTGAGYVYDEEDWLCLSLAMNQFSQKYGVKWLLTTSSRTGKSVEEYLGNKIPADILADAVWYGSKPRKVMMSFLGAGSLIFCTEDSMTMLTESLMSGAPVISIAPKVHKENKRYLNQLNRLESMNILKRTTFQSLSSLDIAKVVAGSNPVDKDLSAELIAKLEKYLVRLVG